MEPLTHDDLQSDMGVGVVAEAAVLLTPVMLQHHGVEVTPFFHQLTYCRIAHLERLARQSAAQSIWTQDHCKKDRERQINMINEHIKMLGLLVLDYSMFANLNTRPS